jgi:uncharacterized protein (TIGR03437 family)
VELTVNGVQAPVLYAGGYPGAVNAYQVNFTIPSEITRGQASLQLKVAWIPSPEVVIPIR